MNPTPPSSDDAALRAIEALESESNQLDETVIDEVSIDQPVVPAPYAGPATPPSAPVPTIASLDIPEPVAPPINPAAAPSAIAQSLSETLKNAPDAPPPINIFGVGKKKSKKPTVITLVIILIIGLGIGGYFAYQYFIATPQTTTQVNVPADETSPEATTLTDNSEAVNTEAAQIQTDLSGIDSTSYDEVTLSDKTLYE